MVQSRWKSLAVKHRPGLPLWLSGKESACQCQEAQIQYLVYEDPTCCGTTTCGPSATTTMPT